MKKIFVLLLTAGAIVFSFPAKAQQKAPWKEMEAFHDVMAATFHPSEEGKLEPIKSRSQEMLDKAVAWQTSAAPQGYDKNAVKSSLKKLVTGAKEINKLVKNNAADPVLKEKLSSLHDVFHEIMEKCEKDDHM
jgi:hypothetical protein